MTDSPVPPAPAAVAPALLAWYDREGRVLPWRASPGATPDPYAVWLAEVMLQQTTVAAVKGYWADFLARWPTVADLAAAPLDEVLHAWQGLGYYARARNLKKCAETVAADHAGAFPADEAALRALPGVGRYTAAAVAAIAFGRRAVVVDGNVERLMARLFAVTDPLPAAQGTLHALAEGVTPEDRPGDFAQAMMDLGATLCTPRNPACALCPLRDACAGRLAGLADSLPRKAPKKPRPTRFGTCFWLIRSDGAVLLRRRPESGLLGGMMELPSTEWTADAGPADPGEALAQAPAAGRNWHLLPGTVRHTFTHFHLELQVVAGQLRGRAGDRLKGTWVRPEEFDAHALPTVMKKVVRHALRHATRAGGGAG